MKQGNTTVASKRGFTTLAIKKLYMDKLKKRPRKAPGYARGKPLPHPLLYGLPSFLFAQHLANFSPSSLKLKEIKQPFRFSLVFFLKKANPDPFC